MTAPVRYRWLDLRIDTARQTVARDGVALDVGGLSFQLLAFLLAQGDRVVGFDELIANVWAPAVVNEETVTQRVKLLRQAIGDDGRAPRYIRSVRGRGYQLCAAPEPDEPLATRKPRRAIGLAVAALVVAGASAAGIVAWRYAATPPAPDSLVARATYYAGIGQRDNNERAIALYRQALARTPGDPAALIGLSRVYSARVCLYNFPAEWAERADTLAGQALAKNGNDARAWSAKGYAADCLGRIDDAIAGYEKAFALDDGDDASRASAAYLYQEKGRLADALHANMRMHGDPSRVRYRDVQVARELELLGFASAAEARFRQSFQLTPDNVFSNIAWPRFLFLQGRFIEAQAALDEAMARHTEHIDLYQLAGELALLRGDRAGAARAFTQAATLRPQVSLPGTLARLYGDTPADPRWVAGRIDELDEALRGTQVWPQGPLEIAVLELARGNREAAVAAIDAAIAAGYRDKAYLQTSPLFRALAGDPGMARSIDTISMRIAVERQRVLAADWKPADLGK
ncbi:MAG TPA: winged helix-turn-helix domain-containing protein [Luteibacter sp.]|nr:winged helix-turn-helix domain-containing protein [Luteibacter sp.]